jgi:hypothetical protein
LPAEQGLFSKKFFLFPGWLDPVPYGRYVFQPQLEGRPRFEETFGHLPKVLFVVPKNIVEQIKRFPRTPSKEGLPPVLVHQWKKHIERIK